MFRLAFLMSIGVVQLISAAESMRIEGVEIFGRVHALSVLQIRGAIDATSSKFVPAHVLKPRAIEILNPTEIRAYLPNRDMGWVPYRLVPWINNIKPPEWGPTGHAIEDWPEALHLIRTADRVSIFPVSSTSQPNGTIAPHGDYSRLRPLDPDAYRKLKRLLGNEHSWFHGFDNTFGIGPEPKNAGFIFERGKNKLVLLCFMRWRFEGTLNGQNTGGSFEEKFSDKLDEWKKRYAKPELRIK